MLPCMHHTCIALKVHYVALVIRELIEKTGWKFVFTVFKFDIIFISHATSHWGNFLVNNDNNVADEINEG